ncbi:hypothetical protein NEHOM01_2342 [Nematocida homosporus]|uniref:uncharacterized protein n=1 Tax=Nematocida homosporus TaxID=1912981 RepID=UPI00221E4566|nr:uncharacterized protein NEHOM01_2342 [Nematocida homosporus]KAI5187751.1 hypothetical protein NEHOM01_2342 [Nematocida homosporus]
MEYRSISTAVISLGFGGGEESLKRNPYLTQINGWLKGDEEEVGEIFRFKLEQNSYYGVISSSGRVSWFGVAGSATYLGTYDLVVNEQYTNIFAFLDLSARRDKMGLSLSGVSNGMGLSGVSSGSSSGSGVSSSTGVSNNSISSGNSNEVSSSISSGNSNNEVGSNSSTGVSNEVPIEVPIEVPNGVPNECVRVGVSTAVVFGREEVFIAGGGWIRRYNRSGDKIGEIESGLGEISWLYLSLCGCYLLIKYQKGSLHLYDLKRLVYIYQKKHMNGLTSIFGDVMKDMTFITILGKSLWLGRIWTLEVLLELTYPEDLLVATMDLLQRRIVVGTHTGKIYQTRLDGEPSEFIESQISKDPISTLFFAPCGTILYAISGGSLLSISMKDGKVLRTIMTGKRRFRFSRMTSSYLHLE